MIDGRVLAGYLAVAATRVAGRVFDPSVDEMFDRLAQHVAQRLGWQAVESINASPGDPRAQRRLGQSIDAVAQVDSQFAGDLARLQDRLDREVGRQRITAVRGQCVAQVFGTGGPHGGHHYEFRLPERATLPSAPVWVQLLVVAGVGAVMIGLGLALIGVVGFLAAAVGSSPSGPPELDTAQHGVKLMVTGLVLLSVANLGRVLARRR
jgi:hypothetical protein